MTSRVALTDGGIETDLIFHHGQELPNFAAFVLLDSEEGRELLRTYYLGYIEIAREAGLALVLETPTWRASSDWLAMLDRPASDIERVNGEGVRLLTDLRGAHDDVHVIISGCVGPRADWYDESAAMSELEAQDYHSAQVNALHAAGVDQVTAITMSYPKEAIGIVRAAHAAGVPAVISFTVETDGRLPDGRTMKDAVEAVDRATGSVPLYYMVNCAHTSHLKSSFGLPPEEDIAVAGIGAELRNENEAAGDDGWTARIHGLRANASPRSHAELDAATDLDEGDPEKFGADLARLRSRMPSLNVLGGCCGTDHRHIRALAQAVTGPATQSAE